MTSFNKARLIAGVIAISASASVMAQQPANPLGQSLTAVCNTCHTQAGATKGLTPDIHGMSEKQLMEGFDRMHKTEAGAMANMVKGYTAEEKAVVAKAIASAAKP